MFQNFLQLKKNIDAFISDFPDSPYSEFLKKKKAELRNEIAGRLFDIARIYQKNGREKSAEIYYRKIKTLYPETEYAKKSISDNSN